MLNETFLSVALLASIVLFIYSIVNLMILFTVSEDTYIDGLNFRKLFWNILIHIWLPSIVGGLLFGASSVMLTNY